jgi:hypothetical protein
MSNEIKFEAGKYAGFGYGIGCNTITPCSDNSYHYVCNACGPNIRRFSTEDEAHTAACEHIVQVHIVHHVSHRGTS